tara:strand:- start:1939 stop:2250 length:312 start_codon:yes stop_codon:yes gene_type:complete
MDLGRYFIDKDLINTHLAPHNQRDSNDNITGGGYKLRTMGPMVKDPVSGRPTYPHFNPKGSLLVKTPSSGRVKKGIQSGIQSAYDEGSWWEKALMSLVGLGSK